MRLAGLALRLLLGCALLLLDLLLLDLLLSLLLFLLGALTLQGFILAALLILLAQLFGLLTLLLLSLGLFGGMAFGGAGIGRRRLYLDLILGRAYLLAARKRWRLALHRPFHCVGSAAVRG